MLCGFGCCCFIVGDWTNSPSPNMKLFWWESPFRCYLTSALSPINPLASDTLSATPISIKCFAQEGKMNSTFWLGVEVLLIWLLLKNASCLFALASLASSLPFNPFHFLLPWQAGRPPTMPQNRCKEWEKLQWPFYHFDWNLTGSIQFVEKEANNASHCWGTFLLHLTDPGHDFLIFWKWHTLGTVLCRSTQK